MAKRKTHEEFVAELGAYNSHYTVLGKYVNNRTKILCNCSIHNVTWEAIPANLLRGAGCPACAKEKVKKKLTKTHASFIKELYAMNPKIEILTTYKNTMTKVKCKCKEDGFVWEAAPVNLLSGSGCPKCSGNARKTTNSFIAEMAKVNATIEILGEYVTSKTKIACRCKVDGYHWSPTPNELLSGNGCPKCGGRMRKTTEQFVIEMETVNPDIEVIGEYRRNRERILCICTRHNIEFFKTPQELLRGRGCKSCTAESRSNRQRKSHKEFANELKSISPHLKIVGTYYKSSHPLSCFCIKHGESFSKTPNQLLKGRGCDYCSKESYSKASLKTHKQYIRDLRACNPEIIVYGKYINSATSILVGSKLCEHKWSTSPQYLLDGTGCPICKSSRGERVVRRYLKDRSIDFNHQHTFEDCRYKSVLFFDFYLPKLQIAIEYDGRQHFEPVDAFGGKKEFREVQQRDAVKDRYCKENNIKLIRIPYTEESVEAYLKERLGEVAS